MIAPRTEFILKWVETAIADGAGAEAETQRLLRRALAPAVDAAQNVAGWPATYLPSVVGGAFRLPPEQIEMLAAACLLVFAAADVIDDAQDGQLHSEWPSWKEAVSTGLTLLFLAHQLALASAPEERRGAVAAVLGGTVLSMSLGQQRDLSQTGTLDGLRTEADYLTCVRGKTGASVALFTVLPAVVSGAPAEVLSVLKGWGEAMGAALQVASDLMDALSPAGRDRRAGRPTLVVQRAWSRLAASDRPHLEAAWRGEPQAPNLEFLLQRTGAVAYVRARVGALKLEARELIQGSNLSPSLIAALNQWVESQGRDDEMPL
ncbi:MAG: polyprenyl synthetase family protein [Candidatus Sericytochromatia bacterium]|nr:polyprenyl synthetase family protein [Candidatus Sericytochromatia bacterium]